MKKIKNIRNLIITMLCLTIICMGIGFACLSMKLEEKNSEQPSFNVSIIKVETDTSVKGGYIAPTGTNKIINEGKTVDFTFDLNSPKDELAYTITIKNTGTIPAKIIKVLATPDYINDKKEAASIAPVTIIHNDIEQTILAPSKEVKINLVASYGMGNTANKVSIPYQLTILATSTN